MSMYHHLNKYWFFSCPTEQEALDYVANNGNYPYIIALVEATTETIVYKFLTEPEA